MYPRPLQQGIVPVVVFLAIVLTAPGLSLPNPWTPSGIAPTPVAGNQTVLGRTVSLTVGSAVGTHLASPFFGLNVEDNLSSRSLVALGNYLNSTPFTVFRLGGGNDDYDPTLEIAHVPPSSGVGAYVGVHYQLTNFTWFKAWCLSKKPHCDWMTYLPGEENNTAAAVHVATWFHNVLKFVPTWWEFGNEPNVWKHFGINWTKWSSTDNQSFTGIGYATMVKNYIAAVSAVFPSDKYIGLQSNCACGSSLVGETAALNGPHLAAMAYHNYPWLNNSSTLVGPFFGALNSSRSILNTSTNERKLMSIYCSTCSNIPIEIGEYNAGPVPDHSPFSFEYPSVPFMVASIIQALEANVSMLTFFNLGFLINTTSWVVYPEGLLFQKILSNLTMGTDYPVTINTGGPKGFYGMLIKNGTREALLLADANVSSSITVPIPATIFPLSVLGSYWNWTARLSLPLAHLSLKLPTSFTLSNLAVVMETNY